MSPLRPPPRRPALAALLLSLGAGRAWAGSAERVSALSPTAVASALETAFADLADRVVPATVAIQADRAGAVAAGLEELARDYALPRPSSEGEEPGDVSSGSGVIVRPDGLVLTNHHVISGASLVMVTLQDKRTFPAVVLGSDPRTDVAVLAIAGDGPFPFAPLGDSDRVRVGHWVLAVGHPFDFSFTVTAGIVSARGRRNVSPDEIQDYLQTDASVNPGGSGGPLFNLAGEVIGINTAIFSSARGGAPQSAGIAFAIPSKLAWRVASELLDTGRVARAALGLVTRDVDANLARPRPGAAITHVNPDGPAAAAGLQVGDLVLSVDGETIGTGEDLRSLVLARGVGARLQVTVDRDGQSASITVVSADEARLGVPDVAVPPDAEVWAGLTLIQATPAAAARFGVTLPEDRGPGLLVLAVAPDSPGDSAGIAAGDLLLSVQRAEVHTAAELLEAVRGRRSALVLFWREGGESYAAVGGLR